MVMQVYQAADLSAETGQPVDITVPQGDLANLESVIAI
jgi:hypothetical protein